MRENHPTFPILSPAKLDKIIIGFCDEIFVTPVKDQGVLGTCTSFGVTACAESASNGNIFSEAYFTCSAEKAAPRKEGGDCIAGLSLGAAI